MKRRRRTPASTPRSGLYVYSNPPTLLPPHPSVVRQWLRNGEVDRLENVVLEGQGHKLLGEYASDLKVRAFLKTVPAYLARIDMVHDSVAKGNMTDLKTLLQQAGDGGVSRKKLSSLALCKDQNGVGLLHKAIYYNYPDIARWLVENYPMTVHVRDRDKRTPLHYCGACEDPSWMWGLLVDAGAETTAVDAHGHTPAYYMDHPDQLKLPTTPVNMPASRFTNGPTGFVFKPALVRIWIHDRDLGRLQQVVWEGYGDKLRMETSHHPVVKRFLNAVPYIMGTIRDVHTAVINNDLILLKKKTDDPVPNEILTSKDANGLTPLHKAAGLGHTEIVEYILDRCKKTLSIQDHEGRTPLHYAAALKDNSHIYTLLKEACSDEETLDKKRRPASYYMQKPNEIDSKLLTVIPEAPRTANIYPPTWDWRLLSRHQDSPLSTGRPAAASTNGDSAFEDMGTEDTPGKDTPQTTSDVLDQDNVTSEDTYESQTYQSEVIYRYDEENGEPIQQLYENETRVEETIAEEDNENQDKGGEEEEELKEEVGENSKEEGEDEKQENESDIVEETQNEDKEDERRVLSNGNDNNNEDQENGNNYEETERNNEIQVDADDNGVDVDDDDEMEENTEEEERDRNEGNSEANSRLNKFNDMEMYNIKNSTENIPNVNSNRTVGGKKNLKDVLQEVQEFIDREKLFSSRQNIEVYNRDNEGKNNIEIHDHKDPTGKLSDVSSTETVGGKEKLKDLWKNTQEFIDREILFSSGQKIDLHNSGNEHNERKDKINVTKKFIEAEKQIAKDVGNTKKYEPDIITITRQFLKNEISDPGNQYGGSNKADIHSIKTNKVTKKQQTNSKNQTKVVKFADTVTVINQNNENESYTTDRSRLNQIIKRTQEFLNSERLFVSGVSPDPVKGNIKIDKDIITATQKFLEAEKLYASEQHIESGVKYETDIVKCTRDFLEKEIQYENMMRALSVEVSNMLSRPTTHCEDDDCVYDVIDEEKCMKDSISKQVNNSEKLGQENKEVVQNVHKHDNSVKKIGSDLNKNNNSLAGQITSVNDGIENEGNVLVNTIRNETSTVEKSAEIERKTVVNETEMLVDGAVKGIQNMSDRAVISANKQTENMQTKGEVVRNNADIIGKEVKDTPVKFLDSAEKEIDNIKNKLVNKPINNEEMNENADKDSKMSVVKGKEDKAITTKRKLKEGNKLKDKNKTKLGKISNVRSKTSAKVGKPTSGKCLQKLSKTPVPDKHINNEHTPGNSSSASDNCNISDQRKHSENRNKVVYFKSKHLPTKSKKITKAEVDKFHEHEDTKKITNIQTKGTITNNNNNSSNGTGSEYMGSKQYFSISPGKQMYISSNDERKLEKKDKFISHNLTPASENESDERIKEIVDRGVMEELAELVLNGEGDLLLRHRSDNPEIQLFLNNVPNYMAKIKTVHTAACEGNLRALQSALDRRKFAVSRENHSPLRVTPLHMATLYGRTSILRFLAGRFPETLHARDAYGRTPLHYAATLNDNGHFYNLLITLGADRNLEDDDGKSAEYYLHNPGFVTHKQLLSEFENGEIEGGENDNPDVQVMDQVADDTASARRNNDDPEVLATLERCYHHIHNQPYKSPLLNKFLSQEIFDKLKFRLTKYDHSLLDLILPGIKLFARQKVNTEDINPISIMDYESYYVFEELVVPIAKILNGLDYRFMLDPHPESVFFPWQIVEDGENKYDIDFDSIELDSTDKTILNSAIECSRNLNSHALPSNMTLSQLEQVENMLTGALIKYFRGNETDQESFDKRSIMKSENDIDFDDDGDLTAGNGVYCSLSEVLEPDSEAYRQLKLFDLLDPEIDRSDVRRDKNWPHGRGVYINPAGNIAAWINVQEHLKAIVITNPNNYNDNAASSNRSNKNSFGSVYKKLGELITDLQDTFEFVRHETLGYLTTDLQTVGNGMKLSAVVRLPYLGRDYLNLQELCTFRGLNIKAAVENNCYHLTNTRSLGITELDSFKEFSAAVKNIVDLEKNQSRVNGISLPNILNKLIKK